jgi:hypothetical protein
MGFVTQATPPAPSLPHTSKRSSGTSAAAMAALTSSFAGTGLSLKASR